MSEVSDLRHALQWALMEGKKGFVTVESGAGIWYHCRFCHAVASAPELLNHEDDCKYFHVKQIAMNSQIRAAAGAPPENKDGFLPCTWMSYARGGNGWCSCGQFGSEKEMIAFGAWEKHASDHPTAAGAPIAESVQGKPEEKKP